MSQNSEIKRRAVKGGWRQQILKKRQQQVGTLSPTSMKEVGAPRENKSPLSAQYAAAAQLQLDHRHSSARRVQGMIAAYQTRKDTSHLSRANAHSSAARVQGAVRGLQGRRNLPEYEDDEEPGYDAWLQRQLASTERSEHTHTHTMRII